jgi:hypothetical protein
MGIREMNEIIDQTGWNMPTVAEVISQLAGLPPNMPIFGYDHNKEDVSYFTGIDLDDSGTQPILRFHFSDTPEAKRDPNENDSHDEQVANKKTKAFDLAANSEAATRIIR